MRVLVRLGLLAPSRRWPCLCSGSCPQVLLCWGSPLPHPSSEPSPWAMQWCLGETVVLGAEHGLALGWGRERQAYARMWREKMAGPLIWD